MDVEGSQSDPCKCQMEHCEENLKLIVFFAAINEISKSLDLFENIMNNNYFQGTPILLLFTKKDLLGNKLDISHTSIKNILELYTKNDIDYKAMVLQLKNIFIEKIPDAETQILYSFATSMIDQDDFNIMNMVIEASYFMESKDFQNFMTQVEEIQAIKQPIKTDFAPSLTKKSQIKISYEGYTPLHLASMNGNLEVVKYLLESYSTLDHIWDYSSTLKTPLQLAVENGHFKVVQCIMDVASFNKRLNSEQGSGDKSVKHEHYTWEKSTRHETMKWKPSDG